FLSGSYHARSLPSASRTGACQGNCALTYCWPGSGLPASMQRTAATVGFRTQRRHDQVSILKLLSIGGISEWRTLLDLAGIFNAEIGGFAISRTRGHYHSDTEPSS